MSEDCFGDSYTVHFVGGPFDGDEDVVSRIEHRIDVGLQHHGHYEWKDGKYYWIDDPRSNFGDITITWL